MGKPKGREQSKYRLCGGGSECVKGDSVGGSCNLVAEQDGVHAHGSLHQHDQPKETERKLVTALDIVNALGEKLSEYERAPHPCPTDVEDYQFREFRTWRAD